jgi:multidrug efflux pump
VLPQLQASIPQAIDLKVVMERTTTIRASLRDVERTLLISIGLVILVVFLFLRNWRAALIPSVAVPVSLIGTFGAMYLCGYSLNNLSLMALTIATGFVVDDAIVVLENVSRHIEKGLTPVAAALTGVRRILVIEQNHTGQFFRHLRAEYDLPGTMTSLRRPGAMQFNPGDIHRHLIEWSRA